MVLAHLRHLCGPLDAPVGGWSRKGKKDGRETKPWVKVSTLDACWNFAGMHTVTIVLEGNADTARLRALREAGDTGCIMEEWEAITEPVRRLRRLSQRDCRGTPLASEHPAEHFAGLLSAQKESCRNVDSDWWQQH